jgi:hypothetical protein
VSSIEHPDSPASAASRTVSATSSGASAKPFSKSPETGRGVALTISSACRSASSRVTRPMSGLPSVKAKAAELVASACAPAAAIIRAEPASQGLGMTKQPL